MLHFALPPGPLRILCLGAHSDDIEIGCGGTVLRLLAEHAGSVCQWVVFSASEDAREREARESAARFLSAAGDRRVRVERFRDGHFPVELAAIKELMQSVKREFEPDLVFTHFLNDRHQDHRTVAEVTWQTFRDHLVLEYEVPKYEGDLGHPNVFVPLAERTRRDKIDLVLSGFPSQRGKRWFSEETFVALMRLRGVESGAPEGYAEAFHVRKACLGFPKAAKI